MIVYLLSTRDGPVKEVGVKAAVKAELGNWIEPTPPGQGTPRALDCRNAEGEVVASFRIAHVVGYQVADDDVLNIVISRPESNAGE